MKRFLLALLLVCNTAYAESKWLLIKRITSGSLIIERYIDLNSVPKVNKSTTVYVYMKARYRNTNIDAWVFSTREVDCGAMIARPLTSQKWENGVWDKQTGPHDWFRIVIEDEEDHYLYNTLICKK